MFGLNSIANVSAYLAFSIVPTILAAGIGALRAWLAALEARRLADNHAFDEALASSNFDELGAMLRDRLGSISVEALLHDSVSQQRVFRSLERLTEMLNQPAPEKIQKEDTRPEEYYAVDSQENPDNKAYTRDNNETFAYIDRLPSSEKISFAHKVSTIADEADLNVNKSDIWTLFAKARRDLERAMPPSIAAGNLKLSPRMFRNRRLQAAMGLFLASANQMIHGEEISADRARAALAALRFIGSFLPHADPEKGSD